MKDYSDLLKKAVFEFAEELVMEFSTEETKYEYDEKEVEKVAEDMKWNMMNTMGFLIKKSD